MMLNREIRLKIRSLRKFFHNAETIEEKKNIQSFFSGYIQGLKSTGVIGTEDTLKLMNYFIYLEKVEELEELNQ